MDTKGTDTTPPPTNERPTGHVGEALDGPPERGTNGTPAGHTLHTRRVWRRYASRPTRLLASTFPLADVIERTAGPTEPGVSSRAWLVGPRPGGGDYDGLIGWAFEAPLPDGWQHGRHYLGDPDQPVFRFEHRDGRKVEVLRVSAWLGEGDYPAALAADALREVERLLRVHWRSGDVALLSTPATTGRDLWLRSIPADHAYPVLPEPVQQLIRSTSGQGRWEHLADRHGPTIDGLYGYDMSFSYAGMCSELGVGLVAHDTLDRWEPYERGRYRATVRVPDDWAHIGILPVPNELGGWSYPAEPGTTITTWADGAELHVAQRFGWTIERVHERIVLGKGDPLGRWRDRLVAARDQASCHADRDRGRLVAAALRSLVLHTIGALHGRSSDVTRTASLADAGEQMPRESAASMMVVGDRVVWQEPRPSRWAALSHPEWSSAVWARCRARLLYHRPTDRGALMVPPNRLLSLRTDALYATAPLPWHDTGRVGTLRPTTSLSGPLDTPQTAAQLMDLRAGTHARTRAHDAPAGVPA